MCSSDLFKIANLATCTTSTDAANKGYVDSAVSGVPTTITLIGNVTGSGSTGSPITTTIASTLDTIPLAAADVNINSHKLINVVDPTSAQHASTKNYTDTRTITLTGGVSGSNTLGNSISTTVISVSPTAITGFPLNSTEFLRGDGFWSNFSTGSFGVGIFGIPLSKLHIGGMDSNYTSGPHIISQTSTTSRPQLQILNWTYDFIQINFDCFYNGTNSISSSSTNNFKIDKFSVDRKSVV